MPSSTLELQELPPELIGPVADRLAALLDERLWRERDEHVDVKAVQAQFGLSAGFVYNHAVELGAIRNGTGPRAALLFTFADVRAGLKAMKRQPAVPTVPPSARTRKPRGQSKSGPHMTASGNPLLPLRKAA